MGSILSLIFDKPTRTKFSASLEVPAIFQTEVQIDVSINIDHQMSSNITSNPIEAGSVVTDNVTLNNRQLILEGMIVNQPLIDFNFFGMFSLLDQGERSQNGFELFKEIWKRKLPFRLETKRDTYDPVIITNFAVIENNEIGDALRFTMTVEEVILVQSGTVLIDKTQVAESVEGASSAVNKGKQVSSGASNAVQGKSSSILSKITGLR